MEAVDAFGLLAKVSSKDEILQILCNAYNYKNMKKLPDEVLKRHSQSLGVDPRETAKILRSLGHFSDLAVYKCWKVSEEAGISGDSIEGQLITMAIEAWRSLASSSKVSRPKLLSFSATVCPRPLPRFSSDQEQSESNNLGKSNYTGGGTCLLHLKIQENPNEVSSNGKVNDVTLELPKDILDSLVCGLGHVRSQLSSVTTKNN